MKKYLSVLCAVLAVVLLAGCGVNGGEAGSDEPKKEEKKARVECLTSIQSVYGGGTVVYTVDYETDGIVVTPPELVDASVMRYSPAGLELSSQYYNEEGVERYRTDTTYNENGQKTQWLQMNLVDDIVASRSTYTYNEKGDLLRVDYAANKDFPNGYREYLYDDQGQCTGRRDVDREDYNPGSYSYERDEEGKLLKTVYYHRWKSGEEPTRLGYYTCSYDDGGRLVSEIWTKESYTPFIQWNYYYTYDEAGRLINSRTEDPDDGEVDSEMIYTYDDLGRLISSEDAVDGYKAMFIYGEMRLNERQAENARLWMGQGLIKVYVPAPAPKYER